MRMSIFPKIALPVMGQEVQPLAKRGEGIVIDQCGGFVEYRRQPPLRFWGKHIVTRHFAADPTGECVNSHCNSPALVHANVSAEVSERQLTVLAVYSSQAVRISRLTRKRHNNKPPQRSIDRLDAKSRKLEEIKLVGVSGSLRSTSFNTASAEGGVGEPADRRIRPDRRHRVAALLQRRAGSWPSAVACPGTARMIASSDGIVFCSPEYNGGVPGVLNNAIDWLSGARACPAASRSWPGAYQVSEGVFSDGATLAFDGRAVADLLMEIHIHRTGLAALRMRSANAAPASSADALVQRVRAARGVTFTSAAVAL